MGWCFNNVVSLDSFLEKKKEEKPSEKGGGD